MHADHGPWNADQGKARYDRAEHRLGKQERPQQGDDLQHGDHPRREQHVGPEHSRDVAFVRLLGLDQRVAEALEQQDVDGAHDGHGKGIGAELVGREDVRENNEEDEGGNLGAPGFHRRPKGRLRSGLSHVTTSRT